MKAVQNVDKAIKAISLEIKAAVKSINQEAANVCRAERMINLSD